MKILIVGAGLAGLTLAKLLKDQKHDITLIDQAPSFGKVGYWIYVYDNGRRIINHLGLEKQFTKLSLPVERYELFDEKFNLLYEIDFRKLMQEMYKPVTIDRWQLHNMLVKLVEKRVMIKYATLVESLMQKGKKVVVKFNDKTKSEYDLVVGADGIDSQIRNYVVPNYKPDYYGMHCWMFLLPSQCPIPDRIIHTVDKGAYAIFYPHGSGRCLVYLAAHAEKGKYNAKNTGVKDLKKIFGNFGGMVAEAIKYISPKDSVFQDDLKTIDINKWFNNRVVLVGDAQHALSQLTGQGTSLAMEDAYVLAEEISMRPIDEALIWFAERREERITKMKRAARILTTYMMTADPAYDFIRDQVTRLFVPKDFVLHTIEEIIKPSI